MFGRKIRSTSDAAIIREISAEAARLSLEEAHRIEQESSDAIKAQELRAIEDLPALYQDHWLKAIRVEAEMGKSEFPIIIGFVRDADHHNVYGAYKKKLWNLAQPLLKKSGFKVKPNAEVCSGFIASSNKLHEAGITYSLMVSW